MRFRMNYIIYHRADLDGHSSGALVALDLEKKNIPYTFIPYNYGEKLNFGKETFIPEDEDIFWFVDISSSPEIMNFMKSIQPSSVRWLDHHLSSMEYGGLYPGIISKDHAACYWTWVYLHEHEKVPTYVQLLSDYDSWKNTKDNWETVIRPLQSGMKLRETNPKYSMDVWRELSTDHNENILNDIIYKGTLLLEYDKKLNKIKAGNSFVVEFEGYRALAMNSPMLSSLAFESEWDPEKHDIMMAFYYKKAGHWAVTLYTSKEDINCEALAKKYGGGGHRAASGATLQTEQMMKILEGRLDGRG